MKQRNIKLLIMVIIAILVLCVVIEGWMICQLKQSGKSTDNLPQYVGLEGKLPHADRVLMVMVENRVYKLLADAQPLSQGLPKANALTLYGDFLRVNRDVPVNNFEFTAPYDATGQIYYYPDDFSHVYVRITPDTIDSSGEAMVYRFTLVEGL